MNVRTKHWTLKPHRNMRQHKVFLRHELLKYNSEKSTAKSSALENYISSANLSLSGCSSAEPNSVSVGRCKFQLKKLYLQTVKKVDHLPFKLQFLKAEHNSKIRKLQLKRFRNWLINRSSFQRKELQPNQVGQK